MHREGLGRSPPHPGYARGSRPSWNPRDGRPSGSAVSRLLGSSPVEMIGYLQEAATWLDWVQTELPAVSEPVIEPFGATVMA